MPRDPGLRAGSRGGSCGRGWRATSRSASSVSSANWAAGGNPARELPRIFRRLDSLTAQPSAWSPCRRTSPRDRPRKRLSWLPLGLRGGHPGHVALGTWGPCHRGVKSSREVRLNPLADGARNGVRSCHRPCKPSRNQVSCTTHDGVRTERHPLPLHIRPHASVSNVSTASFKCPCTSCRRPGGEVRGLDGRQHLCRTVSMSARASLFHACMRSSGSGSRSR